MAPMLTLYVGKPFLVKQRLMNSYKICSTKQLVSLEVPWLKSYFNIPLKICYLAVAFFWSPPR